MFKANVKFGSVPVQVEAETIKELIKEASFFGEVPAKCRCGSPSIFPRHRRHEDNDFYEIVCQDCGSTLSLGQHRNQETLFVKNSDGWKDAYKPKQD